MQKSHNTNERLRHGLKQLAAHNYKAVHKSAIQMIHENLADPVPYFLLGLLTSDHGKTDKALDLFKTAANYGGSEPRYHAYYARALTSNGQQNEAKAAVDIAAKQPINEANTADTIGVVYSRTGYHEFAIPFFIRAIELNSAQTNYHFNLAVSQQFSGLFEDAQASYLKAIDCNPDNSRAYTGLVGLKTFSADAAFKSKLMGLYEKFKPDADKAQQLGHALAKICEDNKEFTESLEWLNAAKALKFKESNASFTSDLLNFQAAKETTKPAKIHAKTNLESPIFIVGLPRTGTTLVDRIISSHHDVIAAGELNHIASLIKEISATKTLGALCPDTFAAADSMDLTDVGHAYMEKTTELRRGAARMTDKMPFNFFHAAFIHRALPNARIICLRRSAMDSCLSNYRQLFSAKTPYYNYALNLKHTAQFYTAFDALIAHYRSALPANRFMEVQYESIVHDQENQTRRLLEFCDLDWDEACMRFHENAAPVSTASSVQVRQPLYSGSIGRWKKYGTALDELKEALGPLADS